MYEEKAIQIRTTIKHYLEGIYDGDVLKLKKSFEKTVYLYGDIKGSEYVKSLNEYCEGVKSRKSPNEMGESFRMDILSIEITGNIAIAKLHVPMLGFNYYDYLSLCLLNNEWKIVSKIFTHVE